MTWTKQMTRKDKAWFRDYLNVPEPRYMLVYNKDQVICHNATYALCVYKKKLLIGGGFVENLFKIVKD
uniref:Uncharacterized protein n=1 Tax=viral metagenome TaxID=1070528 RepID=A0A6M3MBT8_9ZZZZ